MTCGGSGKRRASAFRQSRANQGLSPGCERARRRFAGPLNLSSDVHRKISAVWNTEWAASVDQAESGPSGEGGVKGGSNSGFCCCCTCDHESPVTLTIGTTAWRHIIDIEAAGARTAIRAGPSQCIVQLAHAALSFSGDVAADQLALLCGALQLCVRTRRSARGTRPSSELSLLLALPC